MLKRIFFYMSTYRKQALDFMIARSFATKTVILFIGMFLIVVGTELRAGNPIAGYLSISIGLLMDWAIVYIVYIEINRLTNEVKQTQDRIEEAYSEIVEAKDMAEEAKGWD